MSYALIPYGVKLEDRVSVLKTGTYDGRHQVPAGVYMYVRKVSNDYGAYCEHPVVGKASLHPGVPVHVFGQPPATQEEIDEIAAGRARTPSRLYVGDAGLLTTTEEQYGIRQDLRERAAKYMQTDVVKEEQDFIVNPGVYDRRRGNDIFRRIADMIAGRGKDSISLYEFNSLFSQTSDLFGSERTQEQLRMLRAKAKYYFVKDGFLIPTRPPKQKFENRFKKKAREQDQ